jgi:2-methylcitrate dehydratase PrpD
VDERYRIALLDWLACAAAGSGEPAARAAAAPADGLSGRVAAAGVAGHVLDFDDTYAPGLCHLSAAVAPAAVVVGESEGATAGATLAAYAAGLEAMAATARASHPALYMRGLHPTAVCGGVGAAVAAARLHELDERAERSATAIALLRASGLLAGFGSQAKSLQVGLAAASGVTAARLAAAGAEVPLERAAAGFAAALGGRFAPPDASAPAIAENWIKAYPCCLQTHSAIEAAAALRDAGVRATGAVAVEVHPLSRRAAHIGADVADSLEARFSLPYTTALALLRGLPGAHAFDVLDAEALALARRVEVRADERLGQSEAIVDVDGRRRRVAAAVGSPERPLPAERRAAKLRALAGEELLAVLDDPGAPIAVAAAVALDRAAVPGFR